MDVLRAAWTAARVHDEVGRGPFAEVSRLPASLEDRVRAVPGVASAHRFVSHTIQREHRGRPLRMVVQGLSWPDDKGDWLPLIAGRALRQAHYELVADPKWKTAQWSSSLPAAR